MSFVMVYLLCFVFELFVIEIGVDVVLRNRFVRLW